MGFCRKKVAKKNKECQPCFQKTCAQRLAAGVRVGLFLFFSLKNSFLALHREMEMPYLFWLRDRMALCKDQQKVGRIVEVIGKKGHGLGRVWDGAKRSPCIGAAHATRTARQKGSDTTPTMGKVTASEWAGAQKEDMSVPRGCRSSAAAPQCARPFCKKGLPIDRARARALFDPLGKKRCAATRCTWVCRRFWDRVAVVHQGRPGLCRGPPEPTMCGHNGVAYGHHGGAVPMYPIPLTRCQWPSTRRRQHPSDRQRWKKTLVPASSH